MNILDFVEEWAKSKGWWTFKTTKSEDGYLYISKQNPWTWESQGLRSVPTQYKDIFTLWSNNAWDMNGDYPDDPAQKLEPADPDFFLNLEYLIITKT